MNENDITFTPGQIYIVPNRKRYDTLKWYPSNFVEIRPVDNAHKRCKRCKREIKPQYTYCYHCHMAMVRAAAAKGR